MLLTLLWTAAMPTGAETAAPPAAAVAALLPLSGGASDQGEWSRQGLELAGAELKASGTAISLVYEDTRGDARQAVSAYNSLKLRHKLAAVITWGSGVGVALTPLVNRDQVVQMGIATAAPLYRTPRDFTFRDYWGASEEADYLAAALHSRFPGARLAELKMNNDYGTAMVEAFDTAFLRAGGTVVHRDSFQPGETDFRSVLLRVKQSGADLVMFAAYPTEAAFILRQASQLGLKLPFAASTAIRGDSHFWELAGGAAEGLLVSVPAAQFAAASRPAARRFAAAYQAKFGRAPNSLDMYSALAYDGLMLVGRALQRCGAAPPECLRDELFKTRGYAGASGEISFDECGDIQIEFALAQVRGREMVPVR
jgi:branched-chain amino acid transport system substrate-binding protein